MENFTITSTFPFQFPPKRCFLLPSLHLDSHMSVKNSIMMLTRISGQAEVVRKRIHICPVINTHWASFPFRLQLVGKMARQGRFSDCSVPLKWPPHVSPCLFLIELMWYNAMWLYREICKPRAVLEMFPCKWPSPHVPRDAPPSRFVPGTLNISSSVFTTLDNGQSSSYTLMPSCIDLIKHIVGKVLRNPLGVPPFFPAILWSLYLNEEKKHSILLWFLSFFPLASAHEHIDYLLPSPHFSVVALSLFSPAVSVHYSPSYSLSFLPFILCSGLATCIYQRMHTLRLTL